MSACNLSGMSVRPVPSARKNERFLRIDAPAGYDDPVGMLLGCHRRIEKKLATLKALATQLAAKGIDAEATAEAQAMLRYFDAPAAYHHDDEEIDLLPLLETRIADAAERKRLRDLAERLREDHREIERIWSRLKRPLESIAEGFMRALPDTDLQAFITLYKRHIEAEETVIVPLAARWITQDDLAALGRAMAARRGAPFPS